MSILGSTMGRALLGAALTVALAGEAAAQTAKPAQGTTRGGSNAGSGGASQGGASQGGALGNLGSSREPIAIDADRLDVYDKEGRAVFTGNVVAVQGDTNMRCTEMDVVYESTRGQKGQQTAAADGSGGGGLGQDSNIKKINCKGPVTIKTKTQTATGDKAEFDRVANKVFLTGNATLVDGPNIVNGPRVAYDLTTQIARVEGGGGNGQRVRTLIVPGSDKDKPKEKEKEKPKAR